MKRIPIYFMMLMIAVSSCMSEFHKKFEDTSIRLDYLQKGNKDDSEVEILSWTKEPFWGGSEKNCIDTLLKGEYKIEVFDLKNNNLLYSKGYSTLFNEWQTTEGARDSIASFYESVSFPFPKEKVRIRISQRDRSTRFHAIIETEFDPDSDIILSVQIPDYPVHQIVSSGKPSQCIDIAFLPEGYTADEMDKFKADAERFAGYLFSWSPYDEYKNMFNIYAVMAPSEESGTDIPGDSIWKNTLLNSSFYTFNLERYLTTLDTKSVRDAASCVPYDQICILVNHEKYGGGGIYNCFSVFTTDNEVSGFLFLHEFGHGFAGLADEYFTSEVAYNEFFDLSIEPYQENITTLISFESKWKDLIMPGVPIPTPDDSIYYDKVGVFEGGGYMAEGIYRPAHDCSMKSRSINNFCPVCKRAIRRMIENNVD